MNPEVVDTVSWTIAGAWIVLAIIGITLGAGRGPRGW